MRIQEALSLLVGAVMLIVGSLFPGPLAWLMRGLALYLVLILVVTVRSWRKVRPDE